MRHIERADAFDAREILSLQKLAYTSEAELYDDFAIEPLVQSLEKVQEQFENHVFLKAVIEESIVRGQL